MTKKSWVLLSITCLLIGGGGVLVVATAKQPAPPPTTPLEAVTPEQPRLRVLAVQGNEEVQRVVICQETRCQAVPYPDQAGENAVTDGNAWYYYEEAESEFTNTVKHALRRQEIGSHSATTLIEETPLTSPRELLISPDGTKIAFFLDNIDRPQDELTELWIYDAEDGGVRLLVENLYQPDIRSRVRWNSSSTHLMFIADTGEQEATEDQLELLIASAHTPQVQARFTNLPVAELLPIIEYGKIDLSLTADTLVYTEPAIFGRTTVTTIAEGGSPETVTIKDQVPFIQWLEDNTLLYATQDTTGFSFWHVQNETHRFIARRPGTLQSARSDVSGQHIVFAADTDEGAMQLYALDIGQKKINQQGVLTAFGDTTTILHVQEGAATPAAVAGVTTELADEEVIAFVANNATAISGEENSSLSRIIITEEPNTLFLEYRTDAGEERRLLVTVHDARHNEWSIRGRYVNEKSEWRKVMGGSRPDPKPVRLYEWEESVAQWVLKSQL